MKFQDAFIKYANFNILQKIKKNEVKSYIDFFVNGGDIDLITSDSLMYIQLAILSQIRHKLSYEIVINVYRITVITKFFL